MKTNRSTIRWQLCLTMLTSLTARAIGSGAEVDLVTTNWADRWITNKIEITVPRNVFIDQFHTNWTRQFRTNVVEIYATNWQTKRITNVVEVEAIRTREVTAYKTNWNTVFHTNLLAVNAVRTNFVENWRTNWKTLTLTNWQTVLVMKTNWVNQSFTNTVQLDLADRTEPPGAESEPKLSPASAARAEPVPAVRSLNYADELLVEVAKPDHPTPNRLMEIRLTVRSISDPAGPLHVQQWRLESENGAILCYGQDAEFRRELPVGRYKVEVKAQRGSDGPVLGGRATLAVSKEEAVLLPKPTAMK